MSSMMISSGLLIGGGGGENILSSITGLKEIIYLYLLLINIYIYAFVGLWTMVLSLFIIVGLVRLNLCVAEMNCCSLVDDLLGGVALVIGGTDRRLLTNPLICRRCCRLVDVDPEVGESPWTEKKIEK